MNYLNERKRTQVGFGVSLGFHVLLFLLLSVSGFFSLNFASADDDITEVAYLSGGGGGGGGGVIEPPAAEEAVPQPQAEEQPQSEPIAELPADAIIDPSLKDENAPKPTTSSRPAANENTGAGGGFGSGNGTGSGSGTGSGNGSGTGSGDGDGNGAGTGSGIYDSPAIPPRLISSSFPEYSVASRRAGHEGTALIQMLIGTDGEVEEVNLISSSGYDELDQAALEACAGWSFSAAKNSAGRKVRCYITQPITFRLK